MYHTGTLKLSSNGANASTTVENGEFTSCSSSQYQIYQFIMM
jgi:hypothetical protein